MKVVIDKISLMTCCFRPSTIGSIVLKSLRKVGLKEKYYDPVLENEVFIVDSKSKDPKTLDIHFKVIDE